MSTSTTLPEEFRRTMAGVAASVAVVTTMVEGQPHGTTVSAWTSLSMLPPMTLVSLDRDSRLLARVRRSMTFGINILGAHQAAIAAGFAGSAHDRFRDVAWTEADGLPRIDGTAGWVACRVARFVAAGDHVVLLSNVLAAEPAGSAPLTYHERRFGTHVPLPARSA